MPTPNIQNIRYGNASVTFNGQNLGHTKGGIEFKYAPNTTEITVDQYGSTPVGVIITGEKVTVKIPFAELTSLQWDAAVAAGAQSGESVLMGVNAGSLVTAYPLTLTPLNAAFASETIQLWSAIAEGDASVKYTPDQQRVLEVTFTAIINESKAVGNRLGTIGFVS